jgi:NADH-quinone oxidoreductase subunit L
VLNLLWLVPALPLAGFAVLALSSGTLGRGAIAWIGTGSAGLAALVATAIATSFAIAPPPGDAFAQALWRWIEAGNFSAGASLYLDPLAVVMMLVVTVVGFLIHLYSAEYMRAEEGYNRYFAYLNLFVAAMLVLVLARDLAFLFLGWEGVGLCSYLLIGFWYREPANGGAAQKAFIVTRVGDAAMAIGLFLLFATLGTLDIPRVLARADSHWTSGAVMPELVAALLLAGAVGKSAQIPLQTWLPDAMAGPTPVSALIHAATMVTAGVYLIARMHPLYTLSPVAQSGVAVIGALTLLVAGGAALVQRDIKRVLAYSTISQIGYMFLALGVGAWTAAIFHFMTHACFKALLFLGAGTVIHALDGEHDILRMGGLRKPLPLAFWSMAIGGASLAALPLVTAGFYSKDLILWSSYASSRGDAWLWIAGWVGAALTALYIFRLVFCVFFGPLRACPVNGVGWRVRLPLLVLAALSIVIGFVDAPMLSRHLEALSALLESVFPPVPLAAVASGVEPALEALAMLASLGGIALAYALFIRRRDLVARLAQSPIAARMGRFLEAGLEFDALYDRSFVQPYRAFARANREDVVDAAYNGVADASAAAHRALSRSQNGRLRWYAAALGAGGVALIAIGVWL